MKVGKRCSLGQSQKIAAHAVEWRRVLSLEVAKKKRVTKPRMRIYTTYV